MDRQVGLQNRRCSPRMPVSIDAVIYYNTLMLPDCEIQDLSPEGAFVATDERFLPDQAMVDLAVPTASGSSRRFSAQVVRNSPSGVGVRLLHNDPAAMRSFVEFLYQLPA